MKSQRFLGRIMWVIMLSVLSNSQVYSQPNSLYFSHQDWLVVCDNTATCRAAGYQSDTQHKPISLLLTRMGGGNTAVTAQVHFPSPLVQSYGLRIQGRKFGKVSVNTEGIGQLTPLQTQTLLASAQRHSTIEFFRDREVWQISDQGLKEVLVKMDEFQQRVGTPSALLQKGKQSHQQVLPAQPKPITQIVAVTGHTVELEHKTTQAQAIFSVLKKNTKTEDCPFLWNQHELEQTLQSTALNPQRYLIVLPCWKGAYNFGLGAWVMDHTFKRIIQTVSYNISHPAGEILKAMHKQRGIGDCWSQEQWHWNGQRFVQTLKQTTGLCKGFAGGAWELPTLIHAIQHK